MQPNDHNLQSEKCSICLEELKEEKKPQQIQVHIQQTLNDDSIVALIPCGHSFHNKCIQRCITQSISLQCPLCKTWAELILFNPNILNFNSIIQNHKNEKVKQTDMVMKVTPPPQQIIQPTHYLQDFGEIHITRFARNFGVFAISASIPARMLHSLLGDDWYYTSIVVGLIVAYPVSVILKVIYEYFAPRYN